MNNMITIIKKELARFFGDKRMVFTTILMPGLMIYIMYCFMGTFMAAEMMPDEAYVATALVQNMPAELEPALEGLSAEWSLVETEAAVLDAKQQIQDKQADILVVFPENFAEKVAAYEVSSGEAAPNVEVYYNSSETESVKLRSSVMAILDEYEASMANKLDVNAGDKEYDCATEKDMAAQILGMMMPMLLMIFLYSGCIAVAPESIAGEKERGTIATLLVTPMKRSSLALGKIVSLSIIALLSGISSFVGTFLSLPKLMGGTELGINTAVYSTMDYAMLLGIILSTVIVLIALISIISAFVRSVKEAGTAVSPLMLVMMVISLAPMFMGDGERPLYIFLIPLFNSANCMEAIFSFTYEPVQVAVTILANIAATGIMAYVLTKLFDSEKVMFSK